MADQTLTASWRRLAALFSDPDWDAEEAHGLLHALVGTTHEAPRSEQALVAGEMAAHIRTAGLQEAGPVALAAGVLVEHGGPVEPLSEAILFRLPAVLSASARFVAAARAAFPDDAEGDDEESDDAEHEDDRPEGAIMVGPTAVDRAWVDGLAQRDGEAAVAYTSLDQWCQPLTAMATRWRPLLQRLAADQRLRDALRPLSDATPGAQWLWGLALVPLEETFVFVDAPSQRAFEVLVDGVASNFELHSLLDAALAGPLGHPPPHADVLDCLSGRGPQSVERQSEGRWNLCTWRAAVFGTTPVPHAHWVWNEGRPADIPRFEGRRLVLATPPAYPRSWTTSRTYEALVPRVQLLRELTAADASALNARLRAKAEAEVPVEARAVDGRAQGQRRGSWWERLKAAMGLKS